MSIELNSSHACNNLCRIATKGVSVRPSIIELCCLVVCDFTCNVTNLFILTQYTNVYCFATFLFCLCFLFLLPFVVNKVVCQCLSLIAFLWGLLCFCSALLSLLTQLANIILILCIIVLLRSHFLFDIINTLILAFTYIQ